MKPVWKRKIEEARAALVAAEKAASLMRCTSTTLHQYGPWWSEEIRCLLDKDHPGPCIFHEVELRSRRLK